MNDKIVSLAMRWKGKESALSPRAFDAKRVSFTIRKVSREHELYEFDIEVDDHIVFRAHSTMPKNSIPTAMTLMQVGENQTQIFWLTQYSACPIHLRSIAYALSVWYAQSKVSVIPPFDITAIVSLTCELRFAKGWTTLYAKTPLLRFTGDEVTFSRNKALPYMVEFESTRKALVELYNYLLNENGNKVHFKPIVYNI